MSRDDYPPVVTWKESEPRRQEAERVMRAKRREEFVTQVGSRRNARRIAIKGARKWEK